MKSWSEGRHILRVKKAIFFLEVSQASPIHSFDNINMEVKMLKWLDVVAWDRDDGIYIY
jgi:hypothetical protein